MARKHEQDAGGRVRRVVSKVADVFHRTREQESGAAPVKEARPQKPLQPQNAAKRVTSDIGSDVLSHTYSPLTSGKASFRSDGSDHQSDQELVSGDERWNEEDRFTNKSGDPRIGTHGRTYEPGESDDRQRRP